jgi:heme oxygenase
MKKIATYLWWFEQHEQAKKRAAEAQAKLKAEIAELGDQKELLVSYFKSHPDFLARIKDRIEEYPSKQWRNWVRMKVCSKITNERFELLTLGAPEIREIAHSV